MDYLRQLFGVTFEIIVMAMLLDCSILLKKTRCLFGFYAAVVLICNGYVLFHFSYDQFMKLFPLLVYLPVFLAFLYISKFKATKVFFVYLTAIGIYVSFTIIGTVISYYFGSSRTVVNIVVYSLYLPTGFIIYKYIRTPFLYMIRNTDKGWLAFCVIPLSYIVLIYSTTMYSMDKVLIGSILKNVVLFLIMSFSAYYMIFRFFVQTKEQLTLQNEQDLLKKQVAAAQVHLETLQESQEKTIIYRHDMRHHLNLIDTYLEDDNPTAARNYIAEVEKAIVGAVVEKYCSNYTVNLILSFYLAKAKNDRIRVDTQIVLPEENTVSDMDLCVIFSNAIENAVNACLQIPNINDRAIRIVCNIKNDKLFIQITNSYHGTILYANDLPISSSENHGLGTKSIAAAVEKNGGVCAFTADDKVLKTCIILQLPIPWWFKESPLVITIIFNRKGCRLGATSVCVKVVSLFSSSLPLGVS